MDASLLDLDYLSSVADEDPEFIVELAHSYLNSSVRIMAELREAVRQADAYRVQHAAHALKGSSLAIGANAAGAAFEALENQARDQDLSEADGLLCEAESRYEALTGYMRSQWPTRQGIS